MKADSFLGSLQQSESRAFETQKILTEAEKIFQVAGSREEASGKTLLSVMDAVCCTY